MNFLEDEKGKGIESNVVQKLCNETRNTMNLSFARITSIDHMCFLIFYYVTNMYLMQYLDWL